MWYMVCGLGVLYTHECGYPGFQTGCFDGGGRTFLHGTVNRMRAKHTPRMFWKIEFGHLYVQCPNTCVQNRYSCKLIVYYVCCIM